MSSLHKSILILMFVLPLVAFSPPVGQSVPAASEMPSDWRKLDNDAFKTGEKLVYEVSYGFFTAGTATFESENSFVNYKDRSCYRLHGIVKSATSFEWFYKLHNEFHTYVDREAVVPHHYTRSAREGDYKYDDSVVFDQQEGEVKGKKGTFEMPKYTQDMVSAFYYARTLPLRTAKTGSVFRIPVFIDDNVYDLGLTILGRETINTRFGKVKTIKISPIIVADRVFHDDDQMVLWVSDDENMIPVYCESPVTVGNIKAELKSYSGLMNKSTAFLKQK